MFKDIIVVYVLFISEVKQLVLFSVHTDGKQLRYFPSLSNRNSLPNPACQKYDGRDIRSYMIKDDRHYCKRWLDMQMW